MSINDTCVLSGLCGSLTWRGIPWKSVAAKDRIVLRLSRGGVGAKIGSSPAFLISRATSLARMLGESSSPLLTMIQRVEIGFFPLARASLRGTFCQTCLLSKYSISSFIAAWTILGSKGCPEMASLMTLAAC